jgi:predicted ATP-grasp superfamily ATP-dependent carboligase
VVFGSLQFREPVFIHYPTAMDSKESRGPAVVVPAAGVPSTVACLRSLARVGVHTVVASERPDAVAFASAHCGEGVHVPDPREDLLAYRDALLALAACESVRTVVPVREEDVYVLARYREAFTDHVSLPTPPLDTLRTVHDRLRLVEAAEAAGVPAPETRLLGDVEDWSAPAVVKSRYNLLADAYVDGVGPAEVASSDTVAHLGPGEAPNASALREEMGHDPVVQEFLAGEEYMIGALYDRGEPVATYQHRQVRGTSYTGSGGTYRESVSIPELERVSNALLRQLDWHGLACIEYVRDDAGTFRFVEINPRMWQSLAAAVRAGADFPLYYWLQATGRTDAIEAGHDAGVGCHWLKGELLYALSLFREESTLIEQPGLAATLRAVAGSCYREPHFDYLSADDPGPFLADWLTLFEELPGVDRLGLRERLTARAVGDLDDRRAPKGDTPTVDH